MARTNVRTDIRILFLAANPRDTTPLQLGEEQRLIDERLRAAKFRDRFDLETKFAVRVPDLSQHLLVNEPHIVHFSGHGSDTGELVLQDERGKTSVAPIKAIANLFGILKDNI